MMAFELPEGPRFEANDVKHITPFAGLPWELWDIIIDLVDEKCRSSLSLSNKSILLRVRRRRFCSISDDLQIAKNADERFCHLGAAPCDYIQDITVAICSPPIINILRQASNLQRFRSEFPNPIPKDSLDCLIHSPLKTLELIVEEDFIPEHSDLWGLEHLDIILIELRAPYIPNPNVLLPILSRNVHTMKHLSIPISDKCLQVVGEMAFLTSFRMTASSTQELLASLLNILPTSVCSLELTFPKEAPHSLIVNGASRLANLDRLALVRISMGIEERRRTFRRGRETEISGLVDLNRYKELFTSVEIRTRWLGNWGDFLHIDINMKGRKVATI